MDYQKDIFVRQQGYVVYPQMSVVKQQETVSDQQKVVDKQQGLFVCPQASVYEQEGAGADRKGGAACQFFSADWIF